MWSSVGSVPPYPSHHLFSLHRIHPICITAPPHITAYPAVRSASRWSLAARPRHPPDGSVTKKDAVPLADPPGILCESR